MKKIMIVEDDINIQNELSQLLDNSGYESLILENFNNATEEILKSNVDLILLDINLPYLNGELLLKEIRRTSNIPIIMVTSKVSETDEVLSMSYGADDYITKPYNPTLLLLRINNIFKRVNTQNNIVEYMGMEINIKKGVIIKNSEEIILTKNEMIILNYLLVNKGRIVTRDELMTELWNNEEYVNDNALSVNISRLRTKLKEIGYENAIDTRKGQGYILL